MRVRLFAVALAAAYLLAGAASARPDVLSTLRPGHPRLIAPAADTERVKALIASDPDARALYERIRKNAEALLAEPVMDYTPEDFRENLGVKTYVTLGKVRVVVERIYTLATVYRIEGDRRFLERARAELLNAAARESWNPIHFLDTGEMTHAVAIGYDWLYADLSEDDRRTLRRAIVEKGFGPGRSAYFYRGLAPWGHWVKARHNWNQVCNGGLTLGALAIGDEEPELSRYILEHALESIKLPMAEFAPDGAWAEGPSYWSYATQYNVLMLAGLKTALGTDFGLGQSPGFPVTGLFRMNYGGPSGTAFNYADAGGRLGADEQMYWLAREFGRPEFAWFERRYLDVSKAIALWWYAPGEPPENLPLDAWYQRAGIVFLRGAWGDPDTAWLGFKAGDNQTNHSHLDLGSFVFDALGVRWAADLGGDSYKLPLYFDTYLGNRWKYYRLVTRAHNTLTIDGDQSPKAEARIIAFKSEPDRAFAVADLSRAYGWSVISARRGVALLDRKRLLIQDEVTAWKPVEVIWGMMTAAEVKAEGREATLTRDGASLRARIIEPEGATFAAESARQDPPQNPNEGFTRLTVRLPEKVTKTRIVVELIPFRGEEPAGSPAPVRPLSEW